MSKLDQFRAKVQGSLKKRAEAEEHSDDWWKGYTNGGLAYQQGYPRAQLLQFGFGDEVSRKMSDEEWKGLKRGWDDASKGLDYPIASRSRKQAARDDLIAGADAAYHGYQDPDAFALADQAWFDSQSEDDLIYLWNINPYGMHHSWDDEVYEALASKGFWDDEDEALRRLKKAPSWGKQGAKTADQFSADASECSKCGAAISFDPDTNKWADEDNGSTTCAEGGKHSPTSPDEHRDWELIGAKRKQGATLDSGPRTFDPGQLKAQIGTMNILAISGGRVEAHSNGIRLPVAYGYAVDIFLEADDTYTVETVFTRSGVTKVVNSIAGIYAEQVGEAAYQASLFRDKPWEKGGRMNKVAYPSGRSSYEPGKGRFGEPSPQQNPELFSSEDILAEIKYLMRIAAQNEKTGRDPNLLVVQGYAKLLGILQQRGYTGSRRTAALDDIVAYTYNADIYCPEHILDVMGQPDVGDVEGALDNLAAQRGIDRYAEETFDSGEFPKVVFRDQAQGEHCGMGHEIEASLRRQALSGTWEWEYVDNWGWEAYGPGLAPNGRNQAEVRPQADGTWEWVVWGKYGSSVDHGVAATAEEGKAAAERSGIAFPGTQRLPFAASRKTADISPTEVGVKVGDIFVATWGYDQTNVDFYEITGLTAASVRVRKLQKTYTESGAMAMAGKSVPKPGQYSSEEVTKRLQWSNYGNEPEIKVGYQTWATPWDGQPEYESHYASKTAAEGEYVCGACGLSESEIGGEKDDGSCAHVAMSRRVDARRKQAARPLYEIAADIRREWGDVNYAAVPYLDAMMQLNEISDPYMAESGASIVAYFLSNASQFRGPRAKELKDELRAIQKGGAKMGVGEFDELGRMFNTQIEDMKDKVKADTLPCPEHKDKEAEKLGTYASFPSSYTEYECPEGHTFKVRVGTTREDILAEGSRKMAYDPGNAGTNEPEGSYSPVPSEPFRWLEKPVYSPEHLKYREMFPNGVPMRDEDMTPEQLAYWKSKPKISRKQAAKMDGWIVYYPTGGGPGAGLGTTQTQSTWFLKEDEADAEVRRYPGSEKVPGWADMEGWMKPHDPSYLYEGSKKTGFLSAVQRQARRVLGLDPQSGYGDSSLPTVEDDPDNDTMWPWELEDVVEEVVEEVVEKKSIRRRAETGASDEEPEDTRSRLEKWWDELDEDMRAAHPGSKMAVADWDDRSQAYRDGYKEGVSDASGQGFYRLSNDPRSSESEYAEGYGDGWEAWKGLEPHQSSRITNVWAQNGLDPFQANWGAECDICGEPLDKRGDTYHHQSGMADSSHQAIPRTGSVSKTVETPSGAIARQPEDEEKDWQEAADTDESMWPWELDGSETGEDAADVADVPTPGKSYPQPKKGYHYDEFYIGDQVHLPDEGWGPDVGSVESWDGGWFVRINDTGELTGPWSDDELAKVGAKTGAWSDDDAAFNQGISSGPYYPPSRPQTSDLEDEPEMPECPNCGAGRSYGSQCWNCGFQEVTGSRMLASRTAITLDPDRVPDDTDPAFGWELPETSADPDLGQGAADVADVPTPGDALDGSYPQPSINTEHDDVEEEVGEEVVEDREPKTSRRRYAWTADQSDVSYMADKLMGLTDQAMGPAYSGFRGSEEEKEAQMQAIETKLVELIKPLAGDITDEDQAILEDYNFHITNRAIDRVKGRKKFSKVAQGWQSGTLRVQRGHFLGEDFPAGTEIEWRTSTEDPSYIDIRLPDGVIFLDMESTIEKTGQAESWREIQYQEEHGYLPDQGMTAEDIDEWTGGDPEALEDLIESMSDEEGAEYYNAYNGSFRPVGAWYDEVDKKKKGDEDEDDEDDEDSDEGSGDGDDDSSDDSGDGDAVEEEESAPEGEKEEESSDVDAGEDADEDEEDEDDEKKKRAFRARVQANLRYMERI